MPRYRVFYLREEMSRRFQELPASSVKTRIKAKDYTPAVEIEAPNEYAAWQLLRQGEEAEAGAQAGASERGGGAAPRRFTVGDALETEDGRLRVCLYGGFEDAAWWMPDAAETSAAADGAPATAGPGESRTELRQPPAPNREAPAPPPAETQRGPADPERVPEPEPRQPPPPPQAPPGKLHAAADKPAERVPGPTPPKPMPSPSPRPSPKPPSDPFPGPSPDPNKIPGPRKP